MDGDSTGFSWPTLIASGILALIVSLLSIYFGEPLKNWRNRREHVRKLRFEEELQALGEYSEALRATELACLEAGKLQLNKEQVIRDANSALVGLGRHIDSLVRRLPQKIQGKARETSRAVGQLTAELLPELAVPPGHVNQRIAPKIAGFSNQLREARNEAEEIRSKLFES